MSVENLLFLQNSTLGCEPTVEKLTSVVDSSARGRKITRNDWNFMTQRVVIGSRSYVFRRRSLIIQLWIK